MKKIFSFFLISGLMFSASVFSIFSSPVFAEENRFPYFSDVPTTHQNFFAITGLKQDGVINGYQDGTFKPDQPVSRAEALKILLLGSKISVSQKLPAAFSFSDVPQKEWFAPYTKKAKDLNIIKGRGDSGLFVPADTVNKAEALKMMFLVNKISFSEISEKKNIYADVPSDQWFSPYFLEAQNRKIFDQTSLQKILPQKKLTRGDLAEIMYRFSQNKNNAEFSGMILPENPAPKPEISPALAVDKWEGVKLSRPLSATVHKGEELIVSGEISGNSASEVSVILTLPSGKKEQFVGDSRDGKFDIPVFFPEKGKIQLGILKGKSGSYTTYPVTAVASIPLVEDGSAYNPPRNFSAQHELGRVKLTWKDSNNDFFHIQFRQKERVKNIYVSQKNTILVPVSVFSGFQKGEIQIFIRGAKKGSSSFDFKSDFSAAEKLKISVIPRFTETLSSDVSLSSASYEYTNSVVVRGKVSASGKKNGVKIGKCYALTSGEELFEKSCVKSAGTEFSLSFSPSKKDFYVIEISDMGGRALAVLPMAPKGIFPVLPNDFDLKRSTNTKISVKDVIARINTFRLAHGRSALRENLLISELAQVRAEDMKNRKYFSHVTPGGKTVNTFRSDFGIKVPLSENIALHSQSALDAAYSLEYSPTHRKNLLGFSAKQIGVGAEELSDGSVVLVQLFGADELSESGVVQLEKQILSEVLKKNSHLSSSSVLQKMTQQWSNIMAEKKSAKFEFSSGEKWDDLLDSYKIQRSTQSFVGSFPSQESLMNFVSNESQKFSGTTSSAKKTFGLSLSLSEEGMIFLTMVGEE